MGATPGFPRLQSPAPQLGDGGKSPCRGSLKRALHQVYLLCPPQMLSSLPQAPRKVA